MQEDQSRTSHVVSRAELLERVDRLLPELYGPSGRAAQPGPMGSAPLLFGSDGRVAWDRIWVSFCDLALAGGPPHKGMLLTGGKRADVEAQRGRYRQVVDEICRGIRLACGLEAVASARPGWIYVECDDEAMAAWLLRAITAENVDVRCPGAALLLPAAPSFRLEKEVKNVITVLAKTCHYWREHTSDARKSAIAELLHEMDRTAPLLRPQDSEAPELAGVGFDAHVYETLTRAADVTVVPSQNAGWVALQTGSVARAVSLMRLLIAQNVLARREGTHLCVPLNAVSDAACERAADALGRASDMAHAEATGSAGRPSDAEVTGA